MGFGKKSEKCVIPSSVGNGWELLKELWRACFPSGGSGDSRVASGAFKCFLGSIYLNTHTPTSLKKFSSDLH